MYRCSNCSATMRQPQDRCPNCQALLSGVKCKTCNYVGGKSEFINNNHLCPNCNSVSSAIARIPPHNIAPDINPAEANRLIDPEVFTEEYVQEKPPLRISHPIQTVEEPSTLEWYFDTSSGK